MKITNILHVTDFHFSDSHPDTKHKKKAELVSTSFSDEIIINDWRGRFCEASKIRLTDHLKIDVIACTGDLGTAKCKGSLQYGADFLERIAHDLQVLPQNVIVAPGNHDINRQVRVGKELVGFSRVCSQKGFTYAKRNQTATFNHNGLNFLCLNSCLGGTEQAIYCLPDDYWKAEKSMLEKKEISFSKDVYEYLSYQTKAMDIPAIGIKQKDSCLRFLQNNQGNCAIILMHHNPVPAGIIEIRPYANIIDSGPFLLELTNSGQYIIILHGHIHSQAGVSMYSHQDDRGGFVASIGSAGFSTTLNASASIIQVFTVGNNNFLKANIYSIERKQTDYKTSFQYTLQERTDDDNLAISTIDALTKGRTYDFGRVKELLSWNGDDELLAESLVKLEPRRLAITGICQPIDEWRITRKL